jgi:mono/diheme cytochrome c family protein
MEREQAAYEYVKQNGEPVRSLHHAMNLKVKRGADFFVETCIVCHRSSSR